MAAEHQVLDGEGPSFANALRLHAQGRLDEAELACRRLLDVEPGAANAMVLLAMLFHQKGRPAEAVPLLERALKAEPNSADAWNNYGIVLKRLGRLTEAEAAYKRAAELAPNSADAQYNLGNLYNEAQAWARAVACYRKAILLNPNSLPARCNLANALRAWKKPEEALAQLELARGIGGDDPLVLIGLGGVLRDLGRSEEAVAAYGLLVNRQPDHAEAWCNMGVCLRDLRRFDEAEAAFGRAIAIRPDWHTAHYFLGMCLLYRGDYARGFAECEWRLKAEGSPADATPRWQGEKFPGKTLLVLTEQGFGDTLQFLRFLPLAKKLGGRVVVRVAKPLAGIVRRVQGVDQVVVDDAPAPRHDLHVSLVSLPHLLGMTLESLPGKPPYVKAVSERRRRWDKFLAKDKRFKVGLALSGNPAHANDHNRSLPPLWLEVLPRGPGVVYVNLVKKEGGHGLPAYPGLSLLDPTPEVQDFDDTAAIVEKLDLVVTVDTSIAHLAGAMGARTWLLIPSIPDWRWLAEGEESPWYPSLRLYRQERFGEWEPAIARLAEDLDRIAKAGDPPGQRAVLAAARQFYLAGRSADCIAKCRQVIAAEPANAAAWHQLGIAHWQAEEADPALEALDRAVELAPNDPEVHNNRAVVLRKKGRTDEAIASYARAIELSGGRYVDATYNMANALWEQLRYAEAEAAYRSALEQRPRHRESHYNLGNALRDQGRLAEAQQSYRDAIRLTPDFAEVHNSLGICLLLDGLFKEGWDEYEWRFHVQGLVPRSLPKPRWDGRPLPGGTLLLHAEQGLGDTLQFIRYAREAKRRVGRVVVEVQAPLLPLIRGMEGVDEAVAQGEPLPHFDAHLPLLSAPRAFGTELETIPCPGAYLAPLAADLRARWRQRLHRPGKLKVGVVWAGNPRHKNDRLRSIPAELLAKLPLDDPRLALFCLQVGERKAELAEAGLAGKFDDLTDGISDFADTAAILEELDLLIACDTSVVHLAGAMDRPAWVLVTYLPDWRWLMGREDCPWYPSLRLFRQPAPGDWPATLDAVAVALGQRLEAVPAPAPTPTPALLYEQGLALHRAGRLAEAMVLYDRQLAADPRHDDSLAASGVAMLQLGDRAEAERRLRLALEVNPRRVDALSNLGIALKGGGRAEEALACYRRAVEIDPAFADGHANLGELLRVMGRAPEAIAHLEQATRLNPGLVEGWNNLCATLLGLRRFPQALEVSRQALALRPDLALAWFNHGIALRETGDAAGAATALARCVELQPGHAAALEALAELHAAAGRPGEAEKAWRALLAAHPGSARGMRGLGLLLLEHNHAQAAAELFQQAAALEPGERSHRFNLGLALFQLNRFAEAAEAFRRLSQEDPGDREALNNLGACLKQCDRYDESIEALRAVTRLSPDYSGAWSNLGSALKDARRLPEAIEALTRAVELDPGLPDGHLNRAHALLLWGDLPEGWREYEWRWQVKGFPTTIRNFPQPLWDGAAFAGKTILLHAEQGFGDTLQFMRYAPMVKARGGRVVMEVQRELMDLSRSQAGVDQLVAKGDPLPPFDIHCPLLTLPLVFGTDVAAIPDGVPYLAPEPERVERWGKRLGPKTGFRVGVVWAGSPTQGNDRNRSLPLAALKPLAEIPGVTLYSVQKGAGCKQLEGAGPGFPIVDLGAEIESFADTAAALMHLDLMLTVCTSASHLAGAVGAKTWVMLAHNADWRWFLDREDSPWYPNIRLFRQPRLGDWEAVVERVARELRALVEGRRPEDDPEDPRLLHARAGQALQTGRPREAVELLGRQVGQTPSAGAYSDFGVALRAVGRLPEALQAYGMAVRLDPGHSAAWYNLANALRAGQPERAEAAFARVLEIEPGHAGALTNLAILMEKQGRAEEAERCHDRILADEPDNVSALSNKALLILPRGRRDEAVALARRAVAAHPQSPLALKVLGYALKSAGAGRDDLEEALEHFNAALAVDPGNGDILNYMGNTLASLGRAEEAVAAFDRALALAPSHADARFNRAQSVLLTGDFAQGWRDYECRWETSALRDSRPNLPSRPWQGQELAGRSILLHCEQGFGDSLQFVRYAPLLARSGARVILQVQPELKRLCASLDPMVPVVSSGDTVPAPDYHCALMSLPAVLGTRLETIPATVPYLRPDPAEVERRRRELAGEGRAVGLVWAGNPKHSNDRRRSVPFELIRRLAEVPGFRFVSLQVGEPAARAAQWPGGMVEMGSRVKDFADTAAVMAALDLVITIDSAPAHLAGALGVPTWLLLPYAPDFRWLRNRVDSPWYPTMRLFRQPAFDDWASVVDGVRGALGVL